MTRNTDVKAAVDYLLKAQWSTLNKSKSLDEFKKYLMELNSEMDPD